MFFPLILVTYLPRWCITTHHPSYFPPPRPTFASPYYYPMSCSFWLLCSCWNTGDVVPAPATRLPQCVCGGERTCLCQTSEPFSPHWFLTGAPPATTSPHYYSHRTIPIPQPPFPQTCASPLPPLPALFPDPIYPLTGGGPELACYHTTGIPDPTPVDLTPPQALCALIYTHRPAVTSKHPHVPPACPPYGL